MIFSNGEKTYCLNVTMDLGTIHPVFQKTGEDVLACICFMSRVL